MKRAPTLIHIKRLEWVFKTSCTCIKTKCSRGCNCYVIITNCIIHISFCDSLDIYVVAKIIQSLTNFRFEVKEVLMKKSYSILTIYFTNQIVFLEILSNKIKFEQIKAIKVIGLIPYFRLYSRIFINILCSLNSFSFYKTKFKICYYSYIYFVL